METLKKAFGFVLDIIERIAKLHVPVVTLTVGIAVTAALVGGVPAIWVACQLILGVVSLCHLARSLRLFLRARKDTKASQVHLNQMRTQFAQQAAQAHTQTQHMFH